MMDRATFIQHGPFRCGSCGAFSGKIHRCTVCGHNMAGDTTTNAR